jgi:pimeloyl-ACP methyl ester carboxylesterase
MFLKLVIKKIAFSFAFVVFSFALLACGSAEISIPSEQSSTLEIGVAETQQDRDNIPPPSVIWKSCFEIYECGAVNAPLNYQDPESGLIEIDLIRIPASAATSLGPLLINFGGPGASGTELVSMYGSLWEFAFPEFDIIGFDPRGVGDLAKVECPFEPDNDEKSVFEEGENLEELFTEAHAYAKACIEMSGELALHVGTNNVARDMDRIREALGFEQISYLGYSYGTRIGAVYASLFPEHVRALILDGPVSPTDHVSSFTPIQGQGFETAWSRFAESCDNDISCDLNEYGGAEEAFSIATDILKISNLPVTGGRELTRGEFLLGTASALYSPYSWQDLIDGFNDIITQSDGTVHQELADQLAGRQEDGTYDNSQAVLFLVNCADDPGRPTDMYIMEAVDKVADQLLHFGPAIRGDTGCAGLPAAIDPLHVGKANLKTPALVIAMEGDPATPLAWGSGLVDAVGDAVLITSNGDGHGAFLTNSDCVTEVVYDYLLDLIVPNDGWSCSEP